MAPIASKPAIPLAEGVQTGMHECMVGHKPVQRKERAYMHAKEVGMPACMHATSVGPGHADARGGLACMQACKMVISESVRCRRVCTHTSLGSTSLPGASCGPRTLQLQGECAFMPALSARNGPLCKHACMLILWPRSLHLQGECACMHASQPLNARMHACMPCL